MAIFQIPTQEILLGPAPIDWCEPNHPESNPFGWEEFHNTWSNASFVAAGVILAVLHLRQKAPTDPLLLISCFFCIMTGVTSAWFHATLTFVACKTDEFFENAMILAGVHALLVPYATLSARPPPAGAARYAAFTINLVLLAMGMFFITEAFAEIHLLAVALTALWLITECAHLIPDPAARGEIFTRRNRAVGAISAAVALWGVDRAHCTPLVQGLHLHAFAWHWGTTLSFALCGGAIMVVAESCHDMTSSNGKDLRPEGKEGPRDVAWGERAFVVAFSLAFCTMIFNFAL